MSRHSRSYNFIRKRFNPNKRFGLYFTIGFLISTFFLFLFLTIIQGILRNDPLIQSDIRVINLLQTFHTPSLNRIMLFITYLGNWQVILAGVIGLSIIFALNKNWRYFLVLILSISLGQLFVWIIKNIIQRPRPLFVNILAQKSYGFPSSHAFISLSFYGLLVYFLFRALESKIIKSFFLVVGFIIVMGIGFSRIYFGVHWPSDVLAGFYFGAAWLTGWITFLEIKRKFNKIKPAKPCLSKSIILIISISIFLIWGNV